MFYKSHIDTFLTSNTFIRILLFFVVLLLLSLTIPNYPNQKAYADGLTQENLPPASVGNRQASLFLKVSPPILISSGTNQQDTFMQFRLFDANNNNNQTIRLYIEGIWIIIRRKTSIA